MLKLINHSRKCSTPMFHFHNFASKCINPKRVDNQDCVVGIFWDVDNKLPKFYPPFEAATRLIKAAQNFGFVKYKNAYANSDAFRHVCVRGDVGGVKPVVPYLCKVCGRKFRNYEKLVNHFRVIHGCERTKRLNEIESSRGNKRVQLVEKYAMRMEKYKYAAREILSLRGGYSLEEKLVECSLVDELKRAGFWAREVSCEARAAGAVLRNHIVDMMDHRWVGCVVLVSDDSNFVEVLKEAKLRCLKTVVIGDANDGALKRVADASFSWAEIMRGKAKKDAVSVVGRWKDLDVHDSTTNEKRKSHEIESDEDSEDSNFEGFLSDEDDDFLQKENDGDWRELKSDARRTPIISQAHDGGYDLHTKS